MQPNPNVYPSIYHATMVAESDTIEWSYPINYLNFLDNLPFGEPMDGSNSYIGFDPTINDCYVSATKHTLMALNPEDKKQAEITTKTYKKRINYRLIMQEHNTQIYNVAIRMPYPCAWTNLKSPWFDKFLETAQSKPFFSVLANGSGTAQLAAASTTSFNTFYKAYAYSPITKINTDKILIYPEFLILTVHPVYDSNGNITGLSNVTSFWRNYSYLKPQDKNPAGSEYDEDLWNNGFKDTIDETTGRITERKIIRCCRISEVLYGNSTHVSIAARGSNWTDLNKRGEYNGLLILAEYYDEDRDAVIYEYPNGIYFVNNQNTQSIVTPWSNFYNDILSNPNVNPNDNAYVTSSTDCSGITVANDTNDETDSNKVIYPSNYLSAEDDGSRFEIHNNVLYYYLNSNGTISTYSSSTYSGRQYYQMNVYSPCFPLKDLLATIASFGLFFVSSPDYISSYTLDDTTTYDSHLYRGKFDDNGISDGTWWQGDDIPDKKLDDIDYNPIDPGPGPGPDQDEENIGSDIIRPSTLGVGGTNGFITQYSLTASQIGEIGRLLWLSFANIDYYKNFLFTLTTTGSIDLANLLDYFVSLRVYPFPLINVPSWASAGQDMYIGAGFIPLHFSSTIHTINNYADYIDAGTCEIPRSYGDFRDLTHCEIMLYLPYCGTVQLNPADVVGGTLHAQYAIDFATGGCIAYVDLYTWDGRQFMIAALSGSIGADIPLTATNATQIAARIASNALNVAGTLGNGAAGVAAEVPTIAVGAASGNVPMAAMGAVGALGAEAGTAVGLAQDAMRIATQDAVKMPMMAGGRGFAGFGSPQTAYVQIRRGLYAEGRIAPQGFTQAYGNMYAKPVTVDSCTGFTVFANVDTSGLIAQADERDAIRSLMQSGIYI